MIGIVTMSSTTGDLPRWGFASPGPLRDELTRLALAGDKTATTGLLIEYGLDGDPVPAAGDRDLLVDSADRPVAVVETVSTEVVRLADVDDQVAIDEGEGYADAAAFRVSHERFWNGYLDELRGQLGDPSCAITDDTEVVAERFRVVAVLGPADGAGIVVRPAMPADRPLVDAFLADHDAAVVARLDEVVDARRHPALIAQADAALAGVATWIVRDGALEILTLHAVRQWHGAGSALIAAARTVARAAGARRLWLITTNDNLDALRFYQRRGFRLARVHAGAVERSRTRLKAAIPETGCFGIPIRDELELEIDLDAAP
jgi:uncharacterized protein YhfF/N-acetylglutamate synthase-like GNAT family acetyltransferase